MSKLQEKTEQKLNIGDRYIITAHSLKEAEEKMQELSKEIDNVLANVDIVFI